MAYVLLKKQGQAPDGKTIWVQFGRAEDKAEAEKVLATLPEGSATAVDEAVLKANSRKIELRKGGESASKPS